jgi:hypothetical protein
MARVGERLRAANVRAIYLAHGTFAGTDALGMMSALDSLLPRFSTAMRGAVKQLIDALAGDIGNYPPDYAELFERSINAPGQPRIPVRLFHWSSEDHHIGRADGAVRLVAELAQAWNAECGRRKAERENPDQTVSNVHSTLRIPHSALPAPRFLLWGHSHAGNVFALATHLLSGDRGFIRAFFRAARPYYRWPIVRHCDVPHWREVRALLRNPKSVERGAESGELKKSGDNRSVLPAPRFEFRLDLVTFGTPVRYGWDMAGCDRLLHFVNHRPCQGLPPHLTMFPPTPDRVLSAADGDYVQHLGIAGTNVMPNLLSFRSWLADRRLCRLLQGTIRARDLWKNLSVGDRVHDAGTTLLVDYGAEKGGIAEHLAGHAVYTRKAWLLFQAEEVVRQFYSDPADGGA